MSATFWKTAGEQRRDSTRSIPIFFNTTRTRVRSRCRPPSAGVHSGQMGWTRRETQTGLWCETDSSMNRWSVHSADIWQCGTGYSHGRHSRLLSCVGKSPWSGNRATDEPVGRKQGTLPWDIPPTVFVYNCLFRCTIDGWPTSRSTFAARRLFCSLSEWVRIDPILICPPRPVVLRVTQTRVRFAFPVSTTPSDLSGLPLREVCILIVLSYSLCWKKIGILRVLSRSCPSAVHLLFPWSAWIQSWSRAPNCSEYPGGGQIQLWIQLNHLFNNRGSCLSHTTDTA